MRITTVTEHDGEPALGIPYTNTDGVLFRIRIKAFRTGIILESLASTVPGEEVGVITLPHILKADDQVAYQAEPIIMGDIEEWFASDETVPLIDFLAGKHSDDAQETDNAPADDQDHEQDQQDHEPDPETDVAQNEPETDQDDTSAPSWLTDLQKSIMRCLGYESGSVADIAEKMGTTTNSDKVQIRKAVHELCDMGFVLKVGTVTQNGRPAQIWGVR